MSQYHVAEFDKAVPAETLDPAYPKQQYPWVKIKIHGVDNDSHWLSVTPETLAAIRAALWVQP